MFIGTVSVGVHVGDGVNYTSDVQSPERSVCERLHSSAEIDWNYNFVIQLKEGNYKLRFM